MARSPENLFVGRENDLHPRISENVELPPLSGDVDGMKGVETTSLENLLVLMLLKVMEWPWEN